MSGDFRRLISNLRRMSEAVPEADPADPNAILEALMAKAKKPHKYKAERTEYNGVRYDSKAEAEHAYRLDLAMQAKKLKRWDRQVPIDVGEPGVDKPYRVDFVVEENDGSKHAEEVKGAEDATFRRRKKQWRKRGPFQLWVFKKGKRVEVIEGGGA